MTSYVPKSTYVVLEAQAERVVLLLPASNELARDPRVAVMAAVGPYDPEIYDSNFKQGPSIQSVNARAPIPIFQSDIDNGTNILRAHAFNPLAASMPPAIANFTYGADFAFRIERRGDAA